MIELNAYMLNFLHIPMYDCMTGEEEKKKKQTPTLHIDEVLIFFPVAAVPSVQMNWEVTY